LNLASLLLPHPTHPTLTSRVHRIPLSRGDCHRALLQCPVNPKVLLGQNPLQHPMPLYPSTYPPDRKVPVSRLVSRPAFLPLSHHSIANHSARTKHGNDFPPVHPLPQLPRPMFMQNLHHLQIVSQCQYRTYISDGWTQTAVRDQRARDPSSFLLTRLCHLIYNLCPKCQQHHSSYRNCWGRNLVARCPQGLILHRSPILLHHGMIHHHLRVETFRHQPQSPLPPLVGRSNLKLRRHLCRGYLALVLLY